MLFYIIIVSRVPFLTTPPSLKTTVLPTGKTDELARAHGGVGCARRFFGADYLSEIDELSCGDRASILAR